MEGKGKRRRDLLLPVLRVSREACEVALSPRDSQMVSGEQNAPVEQAEPPRGVARLENQSPAPLQLPRAFPVEV